MGDNEIETIRFRINLLDLILLLEPYSMDFGNHQGNFPIKCDVICIINRHPRFLHDCVLFCLSVILCLSFLVINIVMKMILDSLMYLHQYQMGFPCQHLAKCSGFYAMPTEETIKINNNPSRYPFLDDLLRVIINYCKCFV